MASQILTVRDAVVAALNAASDAGGFAHGDDDVAFAFGFQARAARVVEIDMPEGFTGLDVAVVAAGINPDTADRDTDLDRVQLEIGIRKRVDLPQANLDGFSEVDGLVEFVEQLRDCLRLGAVEEFDIDTRPTTIDPALRSSDFEVAGDFYFGSQSRLPRAVRRVVMAFGLKFDGVFFNAPAVLDRVDEATRKNLLEQAALTRKIQQQSMRYGDKPSAPGNPPTAHRGGTRPGMGPFLRRRIFFGLELSTLTVVIGPDRLGNSDAPEALEYGKTVRRVVRVKDAQGRRTKEKKTVSVKIDARPSARPALAKSNLQLKGIWADSVKA
jgi:hypothetical protein